MSKGFICLLLLALLGSSFAFSIFQRTVVPEGFAKLGRAPPSQVIKFRLALKQKNLDVLEAKLMDISNPQSQNYGKWLKQQEVLDLVAPAQEEVAALAQWLIDNGASKVDATGRDVIKAQAPAKIVEHIFKTEMHNFQHVESGKVQTRNMGHIHVPDQFSHLVEFVSGIHELYGPSVVGPKTRSINNKRNDVSAGYVIPENIRTTYGLPSTFWVNQKSSICVAEFQDDASFAKEDNDYFNQQMSEQIKVDKIVGPYSPANPDGESTLDVQYAFAIALNATSWFWTVNGWMYEFATDLMNAQTQPLVVSMSWGWPEPRQCQVGQCTTARDYVSRVNTEFMKITSTGITLLAASGDQGAPGDTNPYCDNSDTPLSNIFPGGSPYVLSVGATMFDASSTSSSTGGSFSAPVCQSYPCATTTTEVVCTYPTSLITTGGGFSSYVTRPSWQSAAVQKYLSSGVTLPPSQYFNSANRAFPDVAALGHSYLISIQQQLEQVDGTSCSSPVWGAVISLLNDQRLNSGKAPLGFVNQLIYQLAASQPSAFNDMTTGNNMCTESCCATYGFAATTGWDPVTGWGSPNFKTILNYVKNLN